MTTGDTMTKRLDDLETFRLDAATDLQLVNLAIELDQLLHTTTDDSVRRRANKLAGRVEREQAGRE